MGSGNLSETMMKMPHLAFTGMRQMAMLPVSAAWSMMPGTGKSSSKSSSSRSSSSEDCGDSTTNDSVINDAMETMLRMPPLALMNPVPWTKLGSEMMEQMTEITKQTVSQLKSADMNPEPLFGMGKDAVSAFVKGSTDVVTSALTGDSCDDDDDDDDEAAAEACGPVVEHRREATDSDSATAE